MMPVPMTLEQISEATRHWPLEKVSELVDRLTSELRTGDQEPEAG